MCLCEKNETVTNKTSVNNSAEMKNAALRQVNKDKRDKQIKQLERQSASRGQATQRKRTAGSGSSSQSQVVDQYDDNYNQDDQHEQAQNQEEEEEEEEDGEVDYERSIDSGRSGQTIDETQEDRRCSFTLIVVFLYLSNK